MTSEKISGMQVQPTHENEFELHVAGFWIRFWAYLIDLMVISAIGGILIKPLFHMADIAVDEPFFILLSPYKGVVLLITLLYFFLMTFFFEQTIGKMIFGIQVVQKNGERLTASTLVFREIIGRFISALLTIPYLIIPFMPKKEGLHDIFADTYVVHENLYDKKTIDGQKREQLQQQPIV